MTRLMQASLALLIAGLVCLLTASSPLVTTATAQSQNNAKKEAEESTRDAPPDTTPYRRPTVPADYAPKGMRPIPLVPSIFIVDTVVNNTDPDLTNTDTFNDGETSITVNPVNPNEIVVTAFSGSWGAHAPLWHSTNGGNIWTKKFTIPAPPGIAADGCPCDQTIDYGTANQMAGTFLISDIYSGITTNPSSPAAWNWLVIGGVTQATNFNNSPSPGFVDQPWLLVNTDPTIPTKDNVYAAYDDFTNGNDCLGDDCNIRVSVSYGVNPPNFTVDNQSGTATGSINPGHRLAVDPRDGFVYSLFQRNSAPGAGGSKNINYMLNRSTDGGHPGRDGRRNHSGKWRYAANSQVRHQRSSWRRRSRAVDQITAMSTMPTVIAMPAPERSFANPPDPGRWRRRYDCGSENFVTGQVERDSFRRRSQ